MPQPHFLHTTKVPSSDVQKVAQGRASYWLPMLDQKFQGVPVLAAECT